MSWSIDLTGDAKKMIDSYYMTGLKNMEKVAINRVAPMMENYAKQNAPWTDRTGEARRQLAAKYTRTDESTFTVTLSHGVHYGYWLEYKDSGRYAILRPTLNTLFPDIVEEYRGAWRTR